MFSITTQWESLDFGTDEEKACFARIGIQANNHCFTEMYDDLSATVKKEALLSSYHLAEWLAWNWWRLRYESKPLGKTSNEWLMAHNMSSVGSGYVWPSIITLSDGYRIALISKTTDIKSAYRYLNSVSTIVNASEWESTIDEFIQRVLSRLYDIGISNSNLSEVWKSVQEERACPKLSLYRRLEALLGYDPDEGPSHTIELLVDSKSKFGKDATYELAASRLNKEYYSFDNLKNNGVNSSLNERIIIKELPEITPSMAAWQLGNILAKTVRKQLGNIDSPINNKKLSELMAINEKSITETNPDSLKVGYSLKTSDLQSRLSLSGSYTTGRRFDLARLLADYLMFSNDNLSLASSSSTYRQKLQRSFAAELLCPFDVLKNELKDDFSDDHLENIAEQFTVSPLTVKNILKDNNIIDRDDDLLGDAA